MFHYQTRSVTKQNQNIGKIVPPHRFVFPPTDTSIQQIRGKFCYLFIYLNSSSSKISVTWVILGNFQYCLSQKKSHIFPIFQKELSFGDTAHLKSYTAHQIPTLLPIKIAHDLLNRSILSIHNWNFTVYKVKAKLIYICTLFIFSSYTSSHQSISRWRDWSA